MGEAMIQIKTNKKQYLDLLLLADEQEAMIDCYLERGEMFVLEDRGIRALCVVTDEDNGVCELKNIAVLPVSFLSAPEPKDVTLTYIPS